MFQYFDFTGQIITETDSDSDTDDFDDVFDEGDPEGDEGDSILFLINLPRNS